MKAANGGLGNLRIADFLEERIPVNAEILVVARTIELDVAHHAGPGVIPGRGIFQVINRSVVIKLVVELVGGDRVGDLNGGGHILEGIRGRHPSKESDVDRE